MPAISVVCLQMVIGVIGVIAKSKNVYFLNIAKKAINLILPIYCDTCDSNKRNGLK